MTRLFLIFLFYSMVTSCNQNSSQVEKEYIKNLEERNRTLEKELQEEKNKPPVYIEKKSESVYIPHESINHTKEPKEFFTIGSTEEEVLEVMGDPTDIIDFASIGVKRFSYGFSSVSFKNGRVDGYNNFGKNLKVKVKK